MIKQSQHPRDVVETAIARLCVHALSPGLCARGLPRTPVLTPEDAARVIRACGDVDLGRGWEGKSCEACGTTATAHYAMGMCCRCYRAANYRRVRDTVYAVLYTAQNLYVAVTVTGRMVFVPEADAKTWEQERTARSWAFTNCKKLRGYEVVPVLRQKPRT